MRYVFPLLIFWIFASVATAQPSTLMATSASLAHADSTPTAAATVAAPAAVMVYNIAEEMPAFPGGAAAYAQFMRRTLQYPEQALDAQVSGKVHVSFTVAEDGRLLNPEVVKGLGYGLDQEALRLVRLMPWWNPGKVAGRAVRVRYVLPIIFRAL